MSNWTQRPGSEPSIWTSAVQLDMFRPLAEAGRLLRTGRNRSLSRPDDETPDSFSRVTSGRSTFTPGSVEEPRLLDGGCVQHFAADAREGGEPHRGPFPPRRSGRRSSRVVRAADTGRSRRPWQTEEGIGLKVLRLGEPLTVHPNAEDIINLKNEMNTKLDTKASEGIDGPAAIMLKMIDVLM